MNRDAPGQKVDHENRQMVWTGRCDGVGNLSSRGERCRHDLRERRNRQRYQRWFQLGVGETNDPGRRGRGRSGRRRAGDQWRLRDRNAGDAGLVAAEPGGDHQRHYRAQRERAGSHDDQGAGTAGIQRGAVRLHAGGHADRLHPDQRMHADRRRRRPRPERGRIERLSAGPGGRGLELHPDGECRLQFGRVDIRHAVQLRDRRQLRGACRRGNILQYEFQLRHPWKYGGAIWRRNRPVHALQLHGRRQQRPERRRGFPRHPL